jgi:ParB family chromosome partitioning protein
VNRPRQTITHLQAEQLAAHPGNVRQNLGDLTELGLSIRELGIVEPLIVTEHPDRADVFVILDGHRRFGAGQLAHLNNYPAIVRHDVGDPVDQTITMLATDVHKRGFKPMERARAYGALRERGLTSAEIARRVGASHATVQAYLNLLHLDGETAEKVDAGELPVGKAVDLVVETRQADRVAASRPARGRPKVAYFGRSHRLAPVVSRTCTHAGYYGGVGCGPCWEQAIRADVARQRLEQREVAS